MSKQSQFHRALTPLSRLAAVAMAFWPVLATANCCCKRANFFGSLTAADQADPTPSCCAPKCCADSAAVACATALADCCETSNDCQCRASCGDWVKAVRSEPAKSVAPTDDVAPVDWLATQSLFVFNEQPTIGGLVPDRLPFLLAQDHCALICRWLK